MKTDYFKIPHNKHLGKKPKDWQIPKNIIKNNSELELLEEETKIKTKNKDLLLQDLCSRLPYGVKCWHESLKNPCTIHAIDSKCLGVNIESDKTSNTWWNSIEQIKPYLFPLSSMTEEQKRKYNSLRDFVPTYHYEYGDIVEDTELYDNWESIDYLIANHFDYRELIEMGLAIDATGLNIY